MPAVRTNLGENAFKVFSQGPDNFLFDHGGGPLSDERINKKNES